VLLVATGIAAEGVAERQFVISSRTSHASASASAGGFVARCPTTLLSNDADKETEVELLEECSLF